jgi:hypothetical protein
MLTLAVRRGSHPVDPVHPVKISDPESLNFSVSPCLRGEILWVSTFVMHIQVWLIDTEALASTLTVGIV